jgi:hypothetical protein
MCTLIAKEMTIGPGGPFVCGLTKALLMKGDFMKKQAKLETIIGYVNEMEDDDVVGLIISTEEDDYVVEMNGRGKRLQDEVGARVEATGAVKREKDGTKIISISDFEILEEESEEYEEEEEEEEERQHRFTGYGKGHCCTDPGSLR